MKKMICMVLGIWVAAGFISGCKGDNCKPQADTLCMNGTTYWLNSCREYGEAKEVCQYGCASDRLSCKICEPLTCAELGKSCGSWPNGCGGQVDCDGCQAGQECIEETGECACLFAECGQGCCVEGQACWGGNCLTIEIAAAPNRTEVRVRFDSDVDAQLAENAEAYSVTSPAGDLQIGFPKYDPLARTVSLVSGKQVLGVKYKLSIDVGAEGGLLEAEFWSADTARLWVVDFSSPSYEQYQLTADRVGVGDNCVVYIEQGQAAGDVPQTIAEFDDRVYPILTQSRIAAPDFDGNDKIVILGLDGQDYYGGYFSQVNSYSDADTMRWWRLHSNEMEIVHTNVAYGSLGVQNVVTHEFGHLLYHERHGMSDVYWTYHDEGLAETAVHEVYGVNQGAIDVYLWDPSGLIGNGLSLVNWQYGLYENYVQAYLFWTYLAYRGGGVSTYADIFNLETGSPSEVDTWIADNFGQDFQTILMDNLLANWIQAENGLYSYGEMLNFTPFRAPGVSSGTTSVDLQSFAGTFFFPQQDMLDYPGTQGPNIVYAGIDSSGNVDWDAPFRVAGGALLVFNQSMNTTNYPREHSGPDVASGSRPAPAPRNLPIISPAWLSPPPINPLRMDIQRAWHAKMIERIQREGWPAAAK
ncbi:MAG: hypothetical protein JRJ87_11990 [Deltaproteobacteria bacterium]|nr:hypothetical protein [Deltaproteobacteria bacterium]